MEPLPEKLIEKILSWQYFDLADLLPDQLQATPSLASPETQVMLVSQGSWETQRRRKRQIKDISSWIHVYSIYMLVIASRQPQLLPELVAYQLFIVQHAHKFKYPSWLYYDTAFRKWAAINKYTTWSQMNTHLYSRAFTGQGIGLAWCPICHVEGGNHTFDCPSPMAPPPPIYPSPTFSTPTQYLAPSAPRPPPAKKQKVEHCILFNKHNGACPYGNRCSYPHKCATCGTLGHPTTQCHLRRFKSQ